MLSTATIVSRTNSTRSLGVILALSLTATMSLALVPDTTLTPTLSLATAPTYLIPRVTG
jgi:hypothetical protein